MLDGTVLGEPAGPDDAGLDGIGLEFAALRADGIAMLQRLCGDVWSDYNLHDPGVTTLEQLVYGLTDLAFRTDFGMEDYLTGPDGTIDYARQALYAPQAIFSCEPQTVDDLRRLLFDCVADIADIWIRHLGHGLLAIDVMAELDAPPARVPLAQRVRLAFCAHRALGSDLHHVREVGVRALRLRGLIDTHGERPLAAILAEIYVECDARLASGMTVRRLCDVVVEGASPEQIFDGPATRHSHVSARPQGQGQGALVTVSELVGVIQRIDGVRRVRSLWLVDEHGQDRLEVRCDSSADSYPRLPLPRAPEHLAQLRLQPEQGVEYGASEQTLSGAAVQAEAELLHAEAGLELHKLRFERRAFRSEATHSAEVFAAPLGRWRDLRAYYSIQHDFPAVYGINRFGLPQSASPARKVKAAQFKGYLYPFEQLMANYLQNLQDIPALFGVAPRDQARSYSSQLLDDQIIPRIETLYLGEPATLAERVDGVRAAHDDRAERKSRVYDYLLALYGDAFPQQALRRFNHYHPHDTDDWLLECKRRLITELVELSAARGRGHDYLKAAGSSRTVAALQRRVAILLGMPDSGAGPVSPAWRGAPLVPGDFPDGEPLPEGLRLDPVPPWHGALPALDDAELPFPPERFPATFFRLGASLASYRLAQQGGETLLVGAAASGWKVLRRYAGADQASAAAHAGAAALRSLNQRGEGLHLIEHILLRPQQADPAAPPHSFHPAFYSARISVVLPAWTVRGADRAFRNFAEETVRRHCPAHLHAGFLWLEADAMARFDSLHGDWCAALRAFHLADSGKRERQGESLHEASAQMVAFLREHQADPQ